MLLTMLASDMSEGNTGRIEMKVSKLPTANLKVFLDILRQPRVRIRLLEYPGTQFLIKFSRVIVIFFVTGGNRNSVGPILNILCCIFWSVAFG